MKEIEQIWTELQTKLTTIDKEQNVIKRLEDSRMAAKGAIERLEEFFESQNEFGHDPLSLGNYNRNLAPPFYAKFIFFSKVSAFECLKMDADAGEHEQLYELEFAGIKRFFRQQSELRHYYLSGSTSHDVLYFQNFSHNPIRLDDLIVDISPAVNKGCLLFAYMQALDEYRSYLSTPKEQTALPIDLDLRWTEKPSDLIELGIALEGYIKIDNRLCTLKEIMQALGAFLHVNLSNYSELDNKRRNVLGKEPSFLGKLATKNDKRKEKLANNQRSRTRRG